MAWHYFLSIEPLTLEIAEKSIASMTESNYLAGEYHDLEATEPVPDEKLFLNNYQNGFISLVMLSCYFDSCINSLLRDLRGIEVTDRIYKANKYVRLDALFKDNVDELGRIKSTADWMQAQKAFSMRNSLVHYRNNYPNSVSYLPISSWKIEGEIVGEFFTGEQMQRCSNSIKAVVAEIAQVFELSMTPDQRTIGYTGDVEGDISPFRNKNGEDLAYVAYTKQLNAITESWGTQD